MKFIRDLWQEYKDDKNRISIGINFVAVLVVIAGFTWGVYWASAQEKKAEERAIAQEKKADDRAIVHEKKDADRAITYEKHIDRLVSEQRQQTAKLEENQKANSEQLGRKYDQIVSRKVSAAEAKANGYAERNDEVVLAEAVRRIIASHGNGDRAISDGYKKAIDAGRAACYIYAINDTPDEFGSNFFMTQLDYRPGSGYMRGSSDLLTIREKNNINLCIKSYLEELESAKPNKELIDRAVQQETCWFLLQHEKSGIGSVIEPLDLEVGRLTSYGKKIEVMEPYAKVGAIVGYIGDELSRRARGF